MQFLAISGPLVILNILQTILYILNILKQQNQLECIPVNYSHNNENISSNFTQTSKETSPSMHQVTEPKNPTANQQTTYESDADDDSNNSCTVTLHPTYLVNSQLNQNNKLETINIKLYLKNQLLEILFLKLNNLEK